MMARLRSLIRDQRGNSVVELGFVAPIFFTLVAGSIDVSRAYSAKLNLEQAAQRSIEWLQVRDIDAGNMTTTVDTVKSNAASGAGVSTSNVTVDYWLECNAVRTSWDSACASNQTIARYFSVEVKKDYTPYFTSAKFFQALGSGSTVTLKAKAGIRIQ
jgi:Flp pilus assembly protein TadG